MLKKIAKKKEKKYTGPPGPYISIYSGEMERE